MTVFKVHPITLVGIAIVMGILLYSLLPAIVPQLRTTLAIPFHTAVPVERVSILM